MQIAGTKNLKTVERRRQALDLRLAGATYESIGGALGVSAQAAHKLITRALAKKRAQTDEDLTKLREIELMRLDAQLVALWPKRSDPRVSDTILRIGDRRAKLLGLDETTGPSVVVQNVVPLADIPDEVLEEGLGPKGTLQ